MRMQKTDVEFVLFDARDVILTSTGGGHDDTTVPIIWLNAESVYNFNAIKTNDIDLEIKYAKRDYWSAYTGQLFPEDDPEFAEYTVSAYQKSDPPSGIYTVHAGNTDDYNAVLTWLQSHGTTQ